LNLNDDVLIYFLQQLKCRKNAYRQILGLWNSVLGGAHNMGDGHNVTMHEFAHQLDQIDGAADGAPVLENRSAYVSWAKVLSSNYAQLRSLTEQGRQDVLDSYGATNPAEFFAAATETFFEKPRQLHKKHPELYDELRSYYKLNPLDWVESS
jgi:MtfA peptidase